MDTSYELEYWKRGIVNVAGVDEAGRGPLAGPVVAAAVIFQPNVQIEGVNDSKKLSPKQRAILYDRIYERAVSVGIGIVDQSEIDKINILQATFQAMNMAIGNLKPTPEQLLIDGNRFKGNGIPFTTIVNGDAICFSIAAASVIAKVTRDRLMICYDSEYPMYGFSRHKGYGTKEHIAAIRKYGLCNLHRRSFHLRDKQLGLFERK